MVSSGGLPPHHFTWSLRGCRLTFTQNSTPILWKRFLLLVSNPCRNISTSGVINSCFPTSYSPYSLDGVAAPPYPGDKCQRAPPSSRLTAPCWPESMSTWCTTQKYITLHFYISPLGRWGEGGTLRGTKGDSGDTPAWQRCWILNEAGITKITL